MESGQWHYVVLEKSMNNKTEKCASAYIGEVVGMTDKFLNKTELKIVWKKIK